MSYPILYGETETEFNHNGLGILGDCVSCEVTEEANGIFELYMQYPMDGIHYENIQNRSIIKAKIDDFREPQLFRIYSISKPMSGIVRVSAQHISYDLSGIPVEPFYAPSVASALASLKNKAVVNCPFKFLTDKTTAVSFNVSKPSSIRSLLGGSSGSILDVYGGEYEFDNYVVRLHNKRGEDRGVFIRYGKNLIDIQQEQKCSSVATGIYPYWTGEIDGNPVLVELPEKIINAPGRYNFVKIITVDFTQNFESKPTTEELRASAEKYVKSNNIGIPDVSLVVSFAQIEQSEEYSNLKSIERVGLFDTISVEFPQLGVSTASKAVKIVYDILLDRVKSVTLGSVSSNIADTIATQQQEIQQTPTKGDLQKIQDSATYWLTNGKGYKVERRDDSGNIIDTLYMDVPNIDEAVNVLRIGQSGIGFSHNGVNGPYVSAWTIDGKFNADFIAAGIIKGMIIESGIIRSSDGRLSINLDTGVLSVNSTTGQTLFDVASSTALDGSGDVAQLRMFDTGGQVIARITEDTTRTGGGLEITNNAGTLKARIQSTDKSTGLILSKDGTTVAYLGLAADGTNTLEVTNVNCTNLTCSKINGEDA